jgi:hypothetical protein
VRDSAPANSGCHILEKRLKLPAYPFTQENFNRLLIYFNAPYSPGIHRSAVGQIDGRNHPGTLHGRKAVASRTRTQKISGE